MILNYEIIYFIYNGNPKKKIINFKLNFKFTKRKDFDNNRKIKRTIPFNKFYKKYDIDLEIKVSYTIFFFLSNFTYSISFFFKI